MVVKRWTVRLISSPRWGWGMALLAILLATLLLPNPPIADDFFHQIFFNGSQALAEKGLETAQQGQSASYYLNEMFRFFAPQNNNKEFLQNLGFFPWWADSSLQISFWRPVSALTHWVDYTFWPEHISLMRLQSVVWYGILTGLVWMLFRRLTNRRSIAAWGSLFFVLDTTHLETINWIAARNGMIALVFGLVAVIALHDCRKRCWAVGRWVSYGAFLLSLLSGEAGVASFLMLLGYAFFFDRLVKWRDWVLYTPYVLIFLGWFGLYRWMEFGPVGSGFYLDPFAQTGEFVRHLIVRVPVLVAMSLTGGGSFLNFLPDVALPWLATGGCLLVLGVGLAMRHHLRNHPGLCWGGFVLLSATLPVSATTVFSPRLFLFLSVGSALVLSYLLILLSDLLAVKSRGWRSGSLHLVRGYLLTIHLVGCALVWGLVSMIAIHSVFAPAQSDPLAPIFHEMAGQRVVVIHSPHSFAMLYLPFMMDQWGEKLPAEFHLLLPGYQGFELTRVDRSTLELNSVSGISIPPSPIPFSLALSQPGMAGLTRSERFYRASDRPLLSGEQMARSDRVITVLEADPQAHTVTRIRYQSQTEQGFDDVLWYVWDPTVVKYRQVSPPMIGETRQFAGYIDP